MQFAITMEHYKCPKISEKEWMEIGWAKFEETAHHEESSLIEYKCPHCGVEIAVHYSVDSETQKLAS